MAEPVNPKATEPENPTTAAVEDDSEEDLLDAGVDDEPCQLGFAEEPLEDELLEDRLFPSKIGGRPVWLDYIHLPSIESMKCGKCNQPMLLLMQMYLPSEESDDTYHRMVYVFCCRDGGCHISDSAKSFRVLRCQLPEKNALYSPDATDECDVINDPDMVLNEKGRAMTCAICGCLADKRCSRCKGPAYCSREHQISHWSDPDAPHQKECGTTNSNTKFEHKDFVSALLFEEFEITTDQEPALDAEKELAKGKMLLRKYKKEEKRRLKKGIKDDFEYDDSFGTALKEVEIDPQFEKFQMRVSREPEQVVRFDGKTPLWANSKNQPSADQAEIPACANCGSKRRFELQIMPQILFFLKSNDDVKNPIEFGTLVLYTCEKSCEAKDKEQPYLTEFLWRQNPV